MDLYIIRHAIAELRSPGKPDAARELTADGRERFAREVRALQTFGVRFDRVYHSPWTRAVQTAELCEPLLEGSLVETEYLADDPSPELLRTLEGESVAVVGHEPWMSELMTWLLWGESALARAILFKKGGVAWLEGAAEPSGMILRAFFNPKYLRAAAG